MKRFLSILLVVLTLFALIACNGDEEESSSKRQYDDSLPEDGYTMDDILANLEDAGFDMDDVTMRDKQACEDAPEFADVRDACEGRILFYIEAYDPNGGFLLIYGMQKLPDLAEVKKIVGGTNIEEEILSYSYKNVIAFGTKIRSIKAVFGDDAVGLDGGYTMEAIASNMTEAGFEEVITSNKTDVSTLPLFDDVREAFNGQLLFCVEGYDTNGEYIYVFGTTTGADLDSLRSACLGFGEASVSYITSNVVVFAKDMNAVASALGKTVVELEN